MQCLTVYFVITTVQCLHFSLIAKDLCHHVRCSTFTTEPSTDKSFSSAYIIIYRVRHNKTIPYENWNFWKTTRHIFLYFSSVNGKVYICKTHKFYYDTLSINKTMAVRSAKCHFVSEQQLISTRNRYCFNYCKETWHVDASNIYSDSMFEMSTNCFLHAWSLFAERQYCCINLGLETTQLRSLAQRSPP